MIDVATPVRICPEHRPPLLYPPNCCTIKAEMRSSPSSRRFFTVLLLLTAIGAAIFALIWGEVLYRTAFVISHVVPGTPRWFESGGYEVRAEKAEFAGTNKSIEVSRSRPVKHVAYIYLPQVLKRSSFVIFVPGFTPEGALDPRIVNLAESFAGAGIGVVVPDSETIRKRVFSYDDIRLIIDTFRFLQRRDYVNPERIGLAGFSVAGSYALVAASELGDGPLFVLSLGGYFDLRELFIEVLSKSAVYKDMKRAWEPSSLPEEVVSGVIARRIENKEAHKPLVKENLTFNETRQYVEAMPQEFLYEMNSLSPSSAISKMKTRVFLMHDKNDDIIPVEESRKIRDGIPKDIPTSYSEFSIFRHVTPQTFFSMEILNFSWQVLSIISLLL